VYPDPRVVRFVTDSFIPIRIHVREQAADWKRLGERYGVQWTPTVLVVDSSGEERHRVEGFLPADDFLAQIELGRGKVAFTAGQFDEAERRYRAIVDRYPKTEAAPRRSIGRASRATSTATTRPRSPTPRGASGSATRTAAGRRSRRSGQPEPARRSGLQPQ